MGDEYDDDGSYGYDDDSYEIVMVKYYNLSLDKNHFNSHFHTQHSLSVTPIYMHMI